MMSSAVDIDPTFKHALKLLHSSNSDSAEKIRNLLDELIKQRFGGSKTLASTLSKKHLGEESLAPGSNLYVRKQKPAPVIVPVPVITLPDSKQQSPAKSESESAVPTPESLTVPPPSGPIILSLSDVEGNDEDDDVVMEEEKLKELEDLMCIVCRRMDVSARNRLVECADCHSLYHQDCHKPVISEADANDQENAWFCTLCKGKSIGKTSSSSGSSSRKSETASTTSSSSHSKSSSSKNYESSSSSSSSSKHKSSKSSSSREDRSERSERSSDRDREKDKEKSSSKSSSSSSSSAAAAGSSSSANAAGSSSSTSGAGTPNINIISADKRLQMMKKKAAKMHDSKRKHK